MGESKRKERAPRNQTITLSPEEGERRIESETKKLLNSQPEFLSLTIEMLDVWLPTTDGRWLVMPRYTQPAPEHELVLEHLKLKLPAQSQAPTGRPFAPYGRPSRGYWIPHEVGATSCHWWQLTIAPSAL